MIREAASAQAATAAQAGVRVSCDLLVVSLDDGVVQVLAHCWPGPGPGDCRDLRLPRFFLTPELTLDRVVQRGIAELGAPEGLTWHQVEAFGDPDTDPDQRVIEVGWLVLSPQGWDLPDGGGLHWHRIDQVRDGALGPDHTRVLDRGLRLLQEDLETTAIGTQLCPPRFTLARLRAVYEAVWGVSLDAANFHRRFSSLPGVLISTGELTTGSRGRPATLYRRGPRWRLPHRIVRPGPDLP